MKAGEVPSTGLQAELTYDRCHIQNEVNMTMTARDFDSSSGRHQTVAINKSGLGSMNFAHDGNSAGNEPAAMMRRDHVAVAAKDMSDEDYEAIRDAKYPDGYTHLDALMDDDCPGIADVIVRLGGND
jgi:hypothetical protein